MSTRPRSDDANELLRRRGDADNLYVGIVTLILTGEAYLFVTSQFDSWLPVIVTAAASLVGLAIVRRWSQGFAEISRILDKRFEFLRKLEATETLQRIGATAFTEEYPIYTRTRRKRRGLNSYLQWVFGLVFVLIPLLPGARHTGARDARTTATLLLHPATACATITGPTTLP